MRRTRGAAVCVSVVTATALAGCTDDDGADPPAVTVTHTASSPAAQPSPTEGADAPPVPDLPEPAQAPAEIVGSAGTAPDAAAGNGVGTTDGASGPQLGDACIGANIGMRTVAADGTGIICDNCTWQVDRGQSPTHP